jgi:uncharacterized protein (TIGR00645 family)
MKSQRINKIESGLESFIFFSRWILVPMYLGLILVECVYAYRFFVELFHICLITKSITEPELLVGVLGLVDISMIGNLIAMITIGGYSIFVREIKFSNVANVPKWVNGITSGTLKVKMGGSLIGVSSIHLLKSFINIEHCEVRDVMLQITIHLVFVISTIAMCLVETWLHPNHAEPERHKEEHEIPKEDAVSDMSPRI